MLSCGLELNRMPINTSLHARTHYIHIHKHHVICPVKGKLPLILMYYMWEQCAHSWLFSQGMISEVQMVKQIVYDKEKNFTKCDIMRSSHSVHLSNQNMKCSTCVAQQCGANKVLVCLLRKMLYAKKLWKMALFAPLCPHMFARALRSENMKCSTSKNFTCRGIKIEYWMRSFWDIKESLKIQIWLQIQNGNLDQLEKIKRH